MQFCLKAIRFPKYKLEATYEENGEKRTEKFYDPYAFETQITIEEEQEFDAGICYGIYEKLGAHPMKIKGVEGVYFAVWARMLCVSVWLEILIIGMGEYIR